MSKFQKAPLTDKEKERFAEDFIEGAARSSNIDKIDKGKKEKEKTVALLLRIPKSLLNNLERIEHLTGHKKTDFCRHAIVEAVREKLKQIERDL